MAIGLFLTLAQFDDLLPIGAQKFDLSESVEVNETAGGEILPSSYGPRLWQGPISVVTHTILNADDVVARAELMREAGAAFLLSPRHRAYPQNDPAGALLGASTPTISALNVNNRDIGIAGLPAGYVLRRGDFLSFEYGSAPIRYALHRIVSTTTANGSGVISSIELSPLIRPSVLVGAAIKLIKPMCKVKMVPGTFEAQEHSYRPRNGFSFQWRQTLR